MSVSQLVNVEAQLCSLLEDRILILDGAMGSMIQTLRLDEAAVRGDRFADHRKDLKNFSDILCLTRPDDITEIHRRYLDAGADIICTNTFGASPIGAEEFDLSEEVIAELNEAAYSQTTGPRSLAPPDPVCCVGDTGLSRGAVPVVGLGDVGLRAETFFSDNTQCVACVCEALAGRGP